MTSPSIFRSVLSTLLGFAMAAYGLLRCVHTYPGQEAFARFSAALPAVTAVGAFALAVLAAIIGVLLLLPIFFRILFHSHRRQPVTYTGTGTRSDIGVRTAPLRPLPLRHEGDGSMQANGHEPSDLFAGTDGSHGAYDDISGAHYRAQYGDGERPGYSSRR